MKDRQGAHSPRRASNSRPYPALRPGFFLSLYSQSWPFFAHHLQSLLISVRGINRKPKYRMLTRK